MRTKVEIAGDRHLKTLGNCGGFYSCPKSPDGKRLGPLVGYAAKYEGPDGKQLQFVGDVYANFAKAEVYPNVLRFFAGRLAARVEDQIGLDNVDVLCGAPIGGYSLATALGLATDIKTIKAEKKVVQLATSMTREQSSIVFARHDVECGQSVVIVEDVCNNFSTTDQMIANIITKGGKVVAIACFLNRSLTVDAVYTPGMVYKKDCTPVDMVGLKLPVISLVRLPIDEWKQNEDAVAEDIARGNVVLKPKDDWSRLIGAMNAYA